MLFPNLFLSTVDPLCLSPSIRLSQWFCIGPSVVVSLNILMLQITCDQHCVCSVKPLNNRECQVAGRDKREDGMEGGDSFKLKMSGNHRIV